MSEEQLQIGNDELYHLITENSRDLIRVFNLRGEFVYASPSHEALLGYTQDELLQTSVSEILHPNDVARAKSMIDVMIDQKVSLDGMFQYRHKNGTWVTLDTRGKPIVKNGIVIGVVTTGRDVTEKLFVERQLKQSQAQLEFLAFHDPATQLPNYRMFVEQTTQAIHAAKGTGDHVAVLFLEVDELQHIKNSMGYQYRDQLLKTVAAKIPAYLQTEHTLFRVGDTELTVLLPEIRNLDEAKAAAERILTTFDALIEFEGHRFRLKVSVGLSMFPEDGHSAEILLRSASTAMYYAKNRGKNTYCLFTQEMSKQAYERLAMEYAIQRGIDRGEFVLYYQPRVNPHSESVTSAEVLLRWNPSSDVMIAPSEFIPVAEESGLIIQLGKWVLNEVCKQIQAWKLSGKVPLRVAVNVSSVQFREPDFVDIIKDAIQENGIDPTLLEFEVTESGLIGNAEEAFRILAELKSFGIKTSIDDFGVGYSSLDRLHRMAVDTLKIDTSFIRNMLRNNATIVQTIIALGHHLNMKVIAEGVETREQLERLKQYDCDEVQGFYYSQPLPLNQFEQRYIRKLT